jgi:hypothetical protein
MAGKDLVEIGSNTAKGGFRNEDYVVEKFNNWKEDLDAQQWLVIMEYTLDEIEYVRAVKISGYKTDVQVQVTIKLKQAIDVENLQVKLVSNKRGKNQIDKRWVDNYVEWNMPKDVNRLLKHFTGELEPKLYFKDYKSQVPLKDSRRILLNEFTYEDKCKILNFFKDNQVMIVNDILKGRGKFAAEWMLVIQILPHGKRWVLKSMNYVMNFYGNGEVKESPKHSINIGKILIQRKGGDGGRKTANMLQFNIDPTELFIAGENNN